MREKLAGMVLGAVLLTGLAGSAQAAAVAAAPVTEADGPRMVSAEPVTEKSGRAAAAPTLQKPKALKPGDCIGILGPATLAGDTDFSKAVELLHKLGYRTKMAPSATATWGYFAGTDSQRAADINHFFADDSVQAILCLRGGYGASRVLDRLDYAEIAKHPKLFIGYSDITALHAALTQKSHIVTIHGPMLTSFKAEYSDYTVQNFAKGLTNTQAPGPVPMPMGQSMQTVVPGKAEGTLIGGNLTIINSLVGTPSAIDGRGKLLFIEEVGDAPYRIDRALQQLWQSGLLQQVNGIVYSEFHDCTDDVAPGDFTLDEILAYYGRLAGVPVMKGLPVGHAPDNYFLPLGTHAVMNAGKDGNAELILDEAYAK